MFDTLYLKYLLYIQVYMLYSYFIGLFFVIKCQIKVVCEYLQHLRFVCSAVCASAPNMTGRASTSVYAKSELVRFIHYEQDFFQNLES